MLIKNSIRCHEFTNNLFYNNPNLIRALVAPKRSPRIHQEFIPQHSQAPFVHLWLPNDCHEFTNNLFHNTPNLIHALVAVKQMPRIHEEFIPQYSKPHLCISGFQTIATNSRRIYSTTTQTSFVHWWLPNDRQEFTKNLFHNTPKPHSCICGSQTIATNSRRIYPKTHQPHSCISGSQTIATNSRIIYSTTPQAPFVHLWLPNDCHEFTKNLFHNTPNLIHALVAAKLYLPFTEIISD